MLSKWKSTVPQFRSVSIAAIATCFFSAGIVHAAPVTLYYTGAAFDPSVTIDEPVPIGVYTGANSVTGYIVVDDTVLAAPGGYFSDVDILEWSIDDGRQTLSSSSGDILTYGHGSFSGGVMEEWRFSAESPVAITELAEGQQWGEISTNNYGPYVGDGARIIECIFDCQPFTQQTVYGGDRGSTSGAVGTWGVSAVPIPAAAWLFGSALLGLGVVKRRKG